MHVVLVDSKTFDKDTLQHSVSILSSRIPVCLTASPHPMSIVVDQLACIVIVFLTLEKTHDKCEHAHIYIVDATKC